MSNDTNLDSSADSRLGTGDPYAGEPRKLAEGVSPDEIGAFMIVSEEATNTFYGPLPPPEMLAAYEGVIEGSAERILRQAEETGEHRRRLESAVVGANLRFEARGQWFAFLLALTALAGGIGLIAFGKPIAGASTAIIAVGTLAGVFVWTKHKEWQESVRGAAANHESDLGELQERIKEAKALPSLDDGASG